MTAFDEVAEKIPDRQCVLFLGAGCSIESRAPSGKKLFDLIVDQFVGRSTLARDLTSAFDLACGKDEVNRPSVEEFLWSIMAKLKPARGHEIARQFKWPAILTTNYDQLN